MSKPYETFQHEGLTVKIIQDTDAQSPDDFGDDGIFLVHYHRDFTVTRDKIVTVDEIAALYRGEKSERLKELQREYHFFPVAALIHSGVYLRLGQGGFAEDSGGWDTSHVGAVLVSKKEWKRRDKAASAAASHVDTWNQYLSGDVWGYVVEDSAGDHLDSCGGFYGLDYCREEAKSSAESHAKGIKAAVKMVAESFAL